MSAWRLTRAVLARVTCQPADRLAFDRTCRHCGDPAHGKPTIVGGGPHFSLAHCRDLVVLAVDETFPVGVDVEPAGQNIDALSSLIRHPDDPESRGVELLRMWVRKEASLKASGWGLARDMTTFAASRPLDAAVVEDVDAGPHHVAAVASLSGGCPATSGAARRESGSPELSR
ncbi:MAG: hypothetical protein WKF54_04465 [Nocardioidaceae bacterium]